MSFGEWRCGFLLCLASTTSATLYHYLVGREAPYAWWDIPVVLGTLGGLGLVTGSAGLLVAKLRRDKALIDEQRLGMDAAFIVALGLTGLSGLLLLLFRATPALNLLLAIHLGFVIAFFLAMPYSKFVHGVYRTGALIRHAIERPGANDPKPVVVMPGSKAR